MKTICTDLDVAAPESVSEVLRNAAQKYYQSQSELAASWQDNGAGLIWRDIGRILDRAADACDRARAKRGI